MQLQTNSGMPQSANIVISIVSWNTKYKPNIGLQNISFSGQLTIFGHLHNILNDIKIKIINLLRFKGFNFY